MGREPARFGWGSVRLRTTLAALTVFTLALTLGAWFLVDRQRTALTDNVTTAARLRAKDLASALRDGTLPAEVAVPTEDEAFAQIVDDNGSVVRASPNIRGEPPVASELRPAPGLTDVITATRVPVGDTRFRVVAVGVSAAAGRYTVVVGSSLERVQEAIRDLVAGLVLGAPLLIVVVGATTWLVVGRALRPVEAIRTEVEGITAHGLDRRVPQPRVNDEIGRLAHTMNSMLARLEASTTHERRFVADASHELRSPLTSIRAQLEVDLAHAGSADWQATERDVLTETIRLQRLVDDLLVLARADPSDVPANRDVLDLDDLVLAEARRLRVRAKVRVDARAVSAVAVRADRDALLRVIRNLLDNAERHATEQVTIALGEADGWAEILIRDDGPGVPSAGRERIFQRFTRSDDGRDRDRGGSGLGLAIAREIVAAHDGTLVLDPEGPGAIFRIRLPAER